MENKLTLEHLAPYLPYGLKIKRKDYEHKNLTLLGIQFNDIIHQLGKTPIELIKPILRPLSDMIDNILDNNNDTNYRLNCELSELLNTNDCGHFVKALIENKYYAIDIRLWNDVEDWLNKHHFDWKYNLIEKDLAIDINTL